MDPEDSVSSRQLTETSSLKAGFALAHLLEGNQMVSKKRRKQTLHKKGFLGFSGRSLGGRVEPAQTVRSSVREEKKTKPDTYVGVEREVKFVGGKRSSIKLMFRGQKLSCGHFKARGTKSKRETRVEHPVSQNLRREITSKNFRESHLARKSGILRSGIPPPRNTHTCMRFERSCNRHRLDPSPRGKF